MAQGSLWGRRDDEPAAICDSGAALCGTVVLAGWVVAWLAGFGSAGIENTAGAVPIEDRRAPALIADAELANAPQATTMGNAAVANADVATAAEPVTEMAADETVVASDEPESIVEARVARSVADAAARNTARAGDDSEPA